MVFLTRRLLNFMPMDAVFTKQVTFMSGKGEPISLDAVYQDTHPIGEVRATIIAQHGAPGSHKDFKFITPSLIERNIRVIGINHPGHGHTSFNQKLNSSNEERNNFVRAVLEGLDLFDGRQLIFMGHSRGAENSLQLAIEHPDISLAVVLINPPPTILTQGFRWKIFWIRICSILNANRLMRPAVQKILKLTYNRIIKLRVPSGEVAAATMESIPTLAFEKQIEFIEKAAKNDKIRLLFAYSANDPLISKEDYEHAEMRLGERKRLVFSTHPANEEENIAIGRAIGKEFENGHRVVSALFEPNNHHLNKWRASCIVEAVDGIVKWHEKNKDI